VELGELSPEELAELTVNVLWPPAPASQEERAARARVVLARAKMQEIYAEVTAGAMLSVSTLRGA
jgi:hypothetical protein